MYVQESVSISGTVIRLFNKWLPVTVSRQLQYPRDRYLGKGSVSVYIKTSEKSKCCRLCTFVITVCKIMQSLK